MGIKRNIGVLIAFLCAFNSSKAQDNFLKSDTIVISGRRGTHFHYNQVKKGPKELREIFILANDPQLMTDYSHAMKVRRTSHILKFGSIPLYTVGVFTTLFALLPTYSKYNHPEKTEYGNIHLLAPGLALLGSSIVMVFTGLSLDFKYKKMLNSCVRKYNKRIANR